MRSSFRTAVGESLLPRLPGRKPLLSHLFRAEVGKKGGRPAAQLSTSLIPDFPAVDDHAGANDEGGPARGQEDNHVGDLLGPTSEPGASDSRRTRRAGGAGRSGCGWRVNLSRVTLVTMRDSGGWIRVTPYLLPRQLLT